MKAVKTVMGVLLALLVLAGAFAVKLFLIGEPVDRTQAKVEAEDADRLTAETASQAAEPVSVEMPEPPEEETTEPPIVLDLSEEDQWLLLKIAMAELGPEECEECLALVMRTVLNRVEAGGFGKSVRSVLYAPDQFTPVGDGSFDKAEPNEACHAALDRVLRGWDESQGALYYEFCTGESWHSKNLTLLTEHCNTRFYK